MANIRAWLDDLGLGAYADTFEANAIDARVLPELDTDDLKELGVPLGHRKILVKAIAALRADGETTVAGGEPPAVTPTAERRQLTVLFCDLVGSTAMAGGMDPEEWRAVIGRYRSAVAAVVERYEGHVAQHLGDGVMAYFGWPRAHEDDAARAIHAGLDAVEAVAGLEAPVTLSARVGVATGLVVVGESGDEAGELAVGETPNLAARVQAVAKPGQVVTGDRTLRLVGRAFETENLGRRRLKGLDEPIHLVRITGRSSVETRFDAHAGRLTPLVGREEEIGLLLGRWRQAKDGEGQVVLLSGEAGIGKSRITQVLRERIGTEPHVRLRYQASPHHVNSAFHPVIQQFERAAGFGRDDTAETKLAKMEAALAQGTNDVAAAAPLFATMLSLPTDRYPPLNLSPQKQKEKTIAALADQVAGLARREPVLMIVEDAHWIDPTTIEVLSEIIAQIGDARVLLVITYRPEFQPPWSAACITTLTLTRLGRKQAAAMAERVTFGKALPDAMLEQIVAKTDGVPLFVEELTKTVLEAGFLKDVGDHYVLDGPLPPLAVPSTLQDSLMARLDRLSPVKEVAQIGACIGREFSYELLAAISPMGRGNLQNALLQLVDAELLLQRGAPPEANYVFKHALLQDSARQSLLSAKRRSVHEMIARLFAGRRAAGSGEPPEIIAHHFTEAGVVEPALELWREAAEHAIAKASCLEAIAYLRKAIDLNATLPTCRQRDLGELGLLNLLAPQKVAIETYASPDVGATYRRAQELALTLGAEDEVFPALAGIATFEMCSGNLDAADSLSRNVQRLAEQSGSDHAVLEARRLVGLSDVFQGRFSDAQLHFQSVDNLFEPDAHRPLAVLYGQNHLMSALILDSWALAFKGHYSDALRARERGLEEARQSEHFFSIGYALTMPLNWMWLTHDASSLHDFAKAALGFNEQTGLPLWSICARPMVGLALSRLGAVDDGKRMISETLDIFAQTGTRIWIGFYKGLLADILCRQNALGEAERLIDEAIRDEAKINEGWYRADLYRAKGDIVVTHGRARRDEAERNFQDSLQIARDQEAKSWELRAATSLARLWGEQGERQKAHDILFPVYDWFTEGFDTRDLVEAKALLGELRG